MGDSVNQYTVLNEEIATGKNWIPIYPVVLVNILELEMRGKPLSCFLEPLGIIARQYKLDLKRAKDFHKAREILVRQALWS
jgi:hypothetical protein